MLLALRPPAEVSLREQIGFHQQHPARGEPLPDVVHARPVEVVEQQDDVELAEIGPGSLEIDLVELDGDAGLLRGGLGFRQDGGITIDGNDLGAAFRRGDPMSAPAAGEVEYSNT